MGFFKPLFQKQGRKKHSLGVCIPDAGRAKRGIRSEELEEVVPGKGFSVSGIFHVQDSLMLQGTAVDGDIRKKDKVALQGTRLVVRDIQVENKSADSIAEGKKGALFLKAEKGKFPIIKIGDLLQF